MALRAAAKGHGRSGGGSVGEELCVWRRMRGGAQARRRVCGGWCRVDWDVPELFVAILA